MRKFPKSPHLRLPKSHQCDLSNSHKLFFHCFTGKQINHGKRKYGVWKPEDMINAIQEFRNNTIGINECCRKYNVPKKTFTRHLTGKVKRGLQPEREGRKNVNGRDTALPQMLKKSL